MTEPYIVEGTVDFTSGVARFEQQSSPDGKKLSMLIAGDRSLYESPDPEGEGPSWVHFPADLAKSPRFDPTDPVAMVTDLRTAASRIDDAGKGEVEGDATPGMC